MSMTLDPDARTSIGGNHPPDVREQLAEDQAQLRHEIETVAERANGAPKIVRTDEDLTRVGDIVKAARAVSKKAEQARVAAKEPYLSASRDVDAFFKMMLDRLVRVVGALEIRATDYQRAKAAEERRAREDAARKARDEEERQRALAAKAEEANRHAAAAKAQDKADDAAERARQAEAAAQASAAELTRVRSSTGTVATTRTVWRGEIVDPSAIPLDALRPYLARSVLETAVNTFVRMGGRDLPGVRIFENETASFR